MTFQQISDISQAIAAIAVVLSLIALIVESRQNTKMLRTTAVWDSQHSFVEINETLGDGGVMSDVAFRCITAPESLSSYERYLFHRYMRAVLQRVEAQFALYRNGILDAEIWELRRSFIKSLLQNSVVAEIWRLENKTQCSRRLSWLRSMQPPLVKCRSSWVSRRRATKRPQTEWQGCNTRSGDNHLVPPALRQRQLQSDSARGKTAAA